MGDWSETTHEAGGLVSGTGSTRPVPVRGQLISDLTGAMIGNSLTKAYIPFGTDVRARRCCCNA